MAREGQGVRLLRAETLLVAAPALTLAALGVYAIDLTAGAARSGFSPLAIRQCLYIVVGVVLAALAAVPHYRRVGAAAWTAYAAALALLIFLLIPAVPRSIVTPRNGARAWIDLGPINLQPAELAKIAYVLALARYLRFRENFRRPLGFIPPALITAAPGLLIVLQPDLGTATLFVPALFATLIAAGSKLKHIALVVGVGLALAPLSYPVLLPHQKARIVALIRQVEGDTSGADSSQYQSLKSITLAGAGGATGMGDAHSRAVLDFNNLPEAHNDMVFSVVMNRFGAAGGLATLGLLFTWIAGACLTAARCKDPFGRLVCVGLAAFVAAQSALNVAMCLGLAPIVGITLPFVSYGGSSIVASLLATGLILGVGIRPPVRMARQSFEFGDAED